MKLEILLFLDDVETEVPGGVELAAYKGAFGQPCPCWSPSQVAQVHRLRTLRLWRTTGPLLLTTFLRRRQPLEAITKVVIQARHQPSEMQQSVSIMKRSKREPATRSERCNSGRGRGTI